jgi:hypothetical protein
MASVTKDQLFLELAQFTEKVHDVLEDRDLKDFDDRLYYLGHLAMCARFFMIIHLGKPMNELLAIYKLESMSYGAASRPGEKGTLLKQAWLRFSETLRKDIESTN